MILTRRIMIQLGVFILISLVAAAFMIFGYVRLPALWFGVGRYTVTVQLPEAAGLYSSGNVTYRGTEVGRVSDVRLTPTGVEAVLSMNSNVKIPSDVIAEVHSVSAIGEQYIALIPRGDAPPLQDGAVITLANTTVPPDINTLLRATDTALAAIPNDNLQTLIDEAYVAIGGLGPDIARFVNGSTSVAIDARANLGELTALIDGAAPVLNTQGDTSNSIQAWASHLATVTTQLRDQDQSVRGILNQGPGAADQTRALFERLQPTLPTVMANLAGVGEVLVVYQQGLEQLLVLVPQGTAAVQSIGVPNLGTNWDYKGIYLSFNLNLNLPPPCTTGFLPASQRRAPALVDYPDRPAGDVYCRVPQDSILAVRGARNLPCLTVPGKRAPSVAMCESNEVYQPLNDGMAWKGDPNATLSGQPIPQLPPGSPEAPLAVPPAEPAPPVIPIAAAEYDPATGTYTGPDGQVYTQANLARTAAEEQTWQEMLYPPAAK